LQHSASRPCEMIDGMSDDAATVLFTPVADSTGGDGSSNGSSSRAPGNAGRALPACTTCSALIPRRQTQIRLRGAQLGTERRRRTFWHGRIWRRAAKQAEGLAKGNRCSACAARSRPRRLGRRNGRLRLERACQRGTAASAEQRRGGREARAQGPERGRGEQ
jgi:hypothetical protein